MMVVLKAFHNWRHIKIYVFSWQRKWQWEPFIYTDHGRVHNSNTRDDTSVFNMSGRYNGKSQNLGARDTGFLSIIDTVISFVVDNKDCLKW